MAVLTGNRRIKVTHGLYKHIVYAIYDKTLGSNCMKLTWIILGMTRVNNKHDRILHKRTWMKER